MDALSAAAGTVVGNGGLTTAGRALQKHAGRAGSVFPRAVGSPAEISRAAQHIVDDILTTPGTRFIQRPRGRYGIVIDVVGPTGRGIRYTLDHRFIGFLEP